MYRSPRVAAAPVGIARWRGLRPVALRPGGARPWQRRAVRQPAAARPQVAAAAASPEQQQPGEDPLFESVVERRRRRRHGRRRGRRWPPSSRCTAGYHDIMAAHCCRWVGERRLADWCTYQRRRKEGSAGRLLSTEERVALEAIPGWRWLAPSRSAPVPWGRRRQQVAGFVAQHGRLPRTAITPTSPTPPLPLERELGKWCDRQRQRRKDHQKPELTAGEAADLEAIPGWFWEEWSLKPWEERREQVAAFQQQHGRLPRTDGALLEAERQVGLWCHTQRQRRKGSVNYGGELTAAQQAALEAISGWYWEEWSVDPWGTRLQRVAAFQQLHGRLPRQRPSKRSPLLDSERELGHWCIRQRRRRKGNIRPELTAGQVAALEGILGWYW